MLKKKEIKNENYKRVYRLHQMADFLFYIDDAYKEAYQGQDYIKLEGLVAKGTGMLDDIFELYSCNGIKKADITMEELYVGQSKVEKIEGGDKRVALYPKEQDIPYKAGDILCKLNKEIENATDKQ